MNRNDDEATLLFEGPPPREFGHAKFYDRPESDTAVGTAELRWERGFWRFPSRALSEGDRMVTTTTETIAVPDHRVYKAVSRRVVPEPDVPTEPPLEAGLTYEDFGGETTTVGDDETWLLAPPEYDPSREYWTVECLDVGVREGGQRIVWTAQIPNERVYYVDGYEF